jgi:hypothetical protein
MKSARRSRLATLLLPLLFAGCPSGPDNKSDGKTESQPHQHDSSHPH